MIEQQQAAILRPETLVEEFKKNGVTHIITIPDSETNYLYELMVEQPWLDIIPTSREGETFAIALGLNLAGKVPVVLIQNTGMMESGDSIRGMALDAGFPLLMVVGYRGWTRHGVMRTIGLMWMLRLGYHLGVDPRTLHRLYGSEAR